MSTIGQIRKSPRLVLYGIAFRVLGELARQAGDGAAWPAPGRQDTRRAGQQERGPVRADADAGR